MDWIEIPTVTVFKDIFFPMTILYSFLLHAAHTVMYTVFMWQRATAGSHQLLILLKSRQKIQTHQKSKLTWQVLLLPLFFILYSLSTCILLDTLTWSQAIMFMINVHFYIFVRENSERWYFSNHNESKSMSEHTRNAVM